MIKERSDLQFIFLTKRIERFLSVVPEDWGDGYENVTIGVSVENQARADQRLALLQKLPIKHKNIICQPLIEEVTIQKYLDDIELVMAGGEYHREARPLAYEWVLKLREEAVMRGIPFEFRQCGTHFIKDGRSYQLNYRQLFSQAKKAGINWYPEEKTPTNR
jgi:protein gp37